MSPLTFADYNTNDGRQAGNKGRDEGGGMRDEGGRDEG
jgi:hypothetical protein